MGLSREIIDSPQTLSTLKILTIFFIFYSFLLPVGIAAELRELSLSNGSVLERIRFDLQCETGLTSAASLFRYLKSVKLDQVQWSGFSRLRLLEVKVDMFRGIEGLLAEPEPSTFNGDLERDVREIFGRAMNRADVEVSVTLYLNIKRPGGDAFCPVLSWERFATYLLISYFTIHCLSALIPITKLPRLIPCLALHTMNKHDCIELIWRRNSGSYMSGHWNTFTSLKIKARLSFSGYGDCSCCKIVIR